MEGPCAFRCPPAVGCCGSVARATDRANAGCPRLMGVSVGPSQSVVDRGRHKGPAWRGRRRPRMEGRPGRRRGAIHPQLTPRFTPSPRPGAAPSHASERETKAARACLTVCVRTPCVCSFGPVPAPALGSPHPRASRPRPPSPLSPFGAARGTREGSRRSRGRSVEPRPREPLPVRRPCRMAEGGRGGILVPDAPSRMHHRAEDRSCMAGSNSSCGDMRWGPPPGQAAGGRERTDLLFLPLLCRPGRDGPSRGRVAGGSGRAIAWDQTCWRGLASLPAHPLTDAAPRHPRRNPTQES